MSIFQKNFEIYFSKIVHFYIFYSIYSFFIILLYKIYMQIRDKPLEYVLVPPKYSIQEKI